MKRAGQNSVQTYLPSFEPKKSETEWPNILIKHRSEDLIWITSRDALVGVLIFYDFSLLNEVKTKLQGVFFDWFRPQKFFRWQNSYQKSESGPILQDVKF